MSFENEFLDFMRDTIVRNQILGYSAYGSPLYSTASSSYQCRIVHLHEAITKDMGAENLIIAIAYVASTATFDPEDQITFPDGTKPKILDMDAYPDEDGPYHHLQIKFGRKK